ncbi:MAG: beta-ketoacyl-ACP synthase III [Armatimonadota bacterium]
MNSLPSIGIASVGAYAPPDVLTNFDLEKIVDTSDEWIRTRSGISTRHISGADCATSDLALPAARLALERAGLAARDLDLIIVATITPDVPLPSTACIMQHRLGAEHAAAFDLSAACTGFIYALTVATAQLQAGQFRNALVIGAESLSKVTDYTDRGTCVLLGDGAGAAVLKPVPAGRGFLSSYLRADGGGMDFLVIPAGGSRCPASIETVNNRMHYIRMSGSEVFKFAVRVMEEAVVTALERAGLTTADVALVVPHQANIRIIEAATKRLGIPIDRWANNIAEYGNTSSASIPLALNECYEAGRLKEGDVVVLVGFGGGLTWGATVLRW